MPIYGLDPHLRLRFVQYLSNKNLLTTASISNDLDVSIITARKLLNIVAAFPDWSAEHMPPKGRGRRINCLVRIAEPDTAFYQSVLDAAQTAVESSRMSRIFAWLADKNDISSNDLHQIFGIKRNVTWYLDRIMREYPGQWRKTPLPHTGRGRSYMMLARIKTDP